MDGAFDFVEAISPQTRRILATALMFIALDTLIAHGPLRHFIWRAFGVDPRESGSKKAQRLASQLAAKLVGMLFLIWVIPPTFRCVFDPELMADRMYARTPLSQRTMDLAASYFLYDIFICVTKFSENGVEFLIHGVICCFVYVMAAFGGPLHYFGAGFLLWELSTPLMYVRWVLLKAGYASSAIMPLANAAFMLVFFGCRNVWGPVLSYEFWKDSAAELAAPRPGSPLTPAILWGVRAMCITLNCLNAYWLSQMVSIALGRRSKPTNKAV